MKRLAIGFLLSAFVLLPAHSQTLISAEDFEGGAADWVDYDRNAATHNASGGHDGGAYISVTRTINTGTDPGGGFGGYIRFRCAVAPNQLPTQNCSGGSFVGDWWLGLGVQELRFWFRHNSAKPGGLRSFIRIPTPNNNPGASGLVLPAVPANTWTEIVLIIDPQNPEFDQQWGGSNPENILTNVGRLQPGYYVDPAEPDYIEANVTFDIDDVRILGTTPTPAMITVETRNRSNAGVVHAHHDGGPGAVAGLNDLIPVVVHGSSTGAGDPVDLDTDDVDLSTLRFGRNGAARVGGWDEFNIDDDSDGIDDVRARFSTGDTGVVCGDTQMSIRGELTTGELFVGTDGMSTNCNAQCHPSISN